MLYWVQNWVYDVVEAHGYGFNVSTDVEPFT